MNRFFALLKAKFKDVSSPASLADAPYFFGGKSKQKIFRDFTLQPKAPGCLPCLLIGFSFLYSSSKAFRYQLRWLLRGTFCDQKVPKKSSAASPSSAMRWIPCGARFSRDAPNSLRSDMQRIFIRLPLRSSAVHRLINVNVKNKVKTGSEASANGLQKTRFHTLLCTDCQRFLAYEPLNSAEGNQTSGKLKQRKRTASTSMIQKAPLLAVLSALFGYFLLQPAKSYSHQLGAAKRRNAFDFAFNKQDPSGASI